MSLLSRGSKRTLWVLSAANPHAQMRRRGADLRPDPLTPDSRSRLLTPDSRLLTGEAESEWTDESKPTIDRRRFLTVLGATGGGALALSGCATDRVEKLIPYLVQAEDQVPGVATWYSSTCTECSTGCGLHVRTREGRAVKLEGNPEHPVNQGKLCSRGQAALQGLYNPGRLKGPMARGANGQLQEITWDDAIARLASKLGAAGTRVAAISGAGRGTFSDLLADWVAALGGRVTRYQPFASEPLRAANRQVFGIDQLAAHDFARAKYIVSFGADFLETWPGAIEHQRGFAQSHGFAQGDVAKFVYLAPRMDLTGLNADEWHPIRPGSEAALALAMANVLLGERGGSLRSALAPFTPAMAAQETGLTAATIERLAREFGAAQPSLAVAGGVGSQHVGTTEVCAAVNVLNYVAGNLGETVRFGADLDTTDGYGALQSLLGAIDGGQVAVLLVHDANPAYTLPRASGFAAKLGKVGFKVSTSMFLDETSALCDLLLPQHHALERWDDSRPRAGVYGLMQPVMEPVFNTLPAGDVLLRTAKRWEARSPSSPPPPTRRTCRPNGRRWRRSGTHRTLPASGTTRFSGAGSSSSLAPHPRFPSRRGRRR